MGIIPKMHTTDFGAKRQENDAAAAKVSSAKRDRTELERDHERLKLVCAAMWELVSDRTALTEDDLIAKVREMDTRDGVADGKLTRVIRKCSSCDRSVPLKQKKCMYCKTGQPLKSVFESL